MKIPREQLVELLAEAGITAEDYAEIGRAKEIVDAVNARLDERGATLRYAVTLVPVTPRTGWPSETAERREEVAGQPTADQPADERTGTARSG